MRLCCAEFFAYGFHGPSEARCCRLASHGWENTSFYALKACMRHVEFSVLADCSLSHAFRLAALADGQLGHRVLGSVGLDAGTQPDEGVYAGDRFFYFSADRLRDRNGDPVPVKGLEIGAYANVIGLSGTLKPEGLPYLSAAFAGAGR